MELPNGEKGSVLIHNNHLEMWGIDEKTLKEVAWNNMHSINETTSCFVHPKHPNIHDSWPRGMT